ncbi:MAG: cell division protein FtsZ, partial [Legionella sp. 21-45-4]
PLLEDVNFSGARGILVNITAGLDMSIGEFEEVGDVVKEFISDDASVVVGTVIDPEMTDEMRVTVIVTGLGEIRSRHTSIGSSPRARLNDSRRTDGTFDYHELDRPAVTRRQTAAPKVIKKSNPEVLPDTDYLDIPAFLRRSEEVEA